MKILFLSILLSLICISNIHGQANSCCTKEIQSINGKIQDRAIPEIEIKKCKGDLPTFHDNSLNPYFPPFRCQGYSSCNSFSAVYFAISYEFNRLRETPASLFTNTFSEMFTYNFLNKGSGEFGNSFFDALEIIRTSGNPYWKDFTIDSTIIYMSPVQWMTGYDKYLESLHNRISGYYMINVCDYEGVDNLKQWLYHHNEDSPYGGVANCIIGGPENHDTINLASDYNGMVYINSFGPYYSHCLTFTGFDDSVTFDFNGDGISTNDVDLNGDDQINLYDHEMGAFIMCETFNTSYANNGRIYYPYRFCSSLNPNRIWDDAAYILMADTSTFSMVTARIRMTHSCREKIKVFTGVSNDTSSLYPESITEYPIFHFQGGNHPMQGIASDSSETIEFALDLTPLLSHAVPDEPIKFFVGVKENDVADTSFGYLEEFEVIDQISGQVFSASQSHLALNNDSTTYLSAVCEITFTKPEITDSLIILDPEISGHPVAFEGGTPDFEWNLINEYHWEQSSVPFPDALENTFNPWDSISFFSALDLDFDFPFYGQLYSRIYVTVEGFVYFEPGIILWPYYSTSENTLKNLKMIAPFFDNMKIRPGGSMSYTKNDSLVVISWKLRKQNSEISETSVDFSVKLHSSGLIDFCYGDLYYSDYYWVSGVSDGTGENFTLFEHSGETDYCQNKSFTYNYFSNPDHFGIDNTGWLSFVRNLISSGDSVYLNVKDTKGLNDKKFVFFKYPEGIFTNDYDPVVFPNPFTDYLYIPVYQQNSSDISIVLYDSYGKIIAEINDLLVNDGYHVLRFENQIKLPSGVYFLKLNSAGKTTVKKIVKA